MLYAIRSGCGPWDRLGRSPHLVLHRCVGTLWGEAGRWIPRARSRRGADRCHVSAAETSMPGQGWIARMKSTTRHVAGERAVAHAPRQLAWSCAWAWRHGALGRARVACVAAGGRQEEAGPSRARAGAASPPSRARTARRTPPGGVGGHTRTIWITPFRRPRATIDSSTVPDRSCSLRYLRALSSATLPCPTSRQVISAGR